jgi:Mrp family chromosome partitioning ATPase
MAMLRSRADSVVIDSPPLSVGADASVVSGWVDGVLMVIDLNKSTVRSVRAALRQLETVKAPVLGFVLNRDGDAEVSRYDYYMPRESRRTTATTGLMERERV